MCGLGKDTSGQELPARLARYRGCVESDVPHLNHAALSAAAARKRHKSESLELQLLAAHIAPNLRLSRVNIHRGTRGTITTVNYCVIAVFFFKEREKIVNKAAIGFHVVDEFWVMAVNEFVWNYISRWLQGCTSQTFVWLVFVCNLMQWFCGINHFKIFLTEKEQQEAIEHIDEVQNEIDR